MQKDVMRAVEKLRREQDRKVAKVIARLGRSHASDESPSLADRLASGEGPPSFCDPAVDDRDD